MSWWFVPAASQWQCKTRLCPLPASIALTAFYRLQHYPTRGTAFTETTQPTNHNNNYSYDESWAAILVNQLQSFAKKIFLDQNGVHYTVD
jgi:hypothetical protein